MSFYNNKTVKQLLNHHKNYNYMTPFVNNKLKMVAGLCFGLSTLMLSGCSNILADSNYNKIGAENTQSTSKIQSSSNSSAKPKSIVGYTYGSRPMYLIDDMDNSPLKTQLKSCEGQTAMKSDFSISHRGAPLQYPEHTYDGYMAAARMGAGILECDVAFTKDKQLVCRHAQNDLHTTTNILSTPLAQKCSTPPKFDAQGILTNADKIECRTSDITLDEFKSLRGKMDAANTKASSIKDYMNATSPWRTELYNQNGKLVSLEEHIKLAESLGLKHTPELKAPTEKMPFGDYTQDQYRKQLIDTYKKAGVSADKVYAQSFDIEDIKYWVKNNPDFAKNAVFLTDDSNETAEGKTFDKNDPKTWKHSMQELKSMGVNIIAPATWLLVTSDGKGRMMPSQYAVEAKKAGLKIITWSIERSGPLANGGGWYYTGLGDAINNDGDLMNYIDVLAQDVGVIGMFSDWPATVTYYANCKGL
ncbi:glycerophosphodiester phosphodiesterase family protein [Psychrobacter sp.]|uniref:glycerophosphodiester phosphodiesterase family protein n=1 Tax=Psychrobacter sp. TaxID=56811 RepID=UPI0025D0DBD7|nr:glycerophosphodiester phosphodiesterase family protein [Psychrobacter sp.]